jgi:hypothetical protein
MFLTQSYKEKFSVSLCVILIHNISSRIIYEYYTPWREKINRRKNDKSSFCLLA